eukprot:360660_1
MSYAERSSPRKSSSRSSFRSPPRYSDRSSSSHRRQSQSSNPLLARRQVGKLEIEKLISAVRDSQRTKHTFAETLMTKIVALCEDSYTHEDFKKIARYSKALERLPAAAIKWMGCCRSPMSVFYNWILALRHILEEEFDSPRQETHDVLARVFKFLLHFDASDMRTEEITVLIEGLNLPYKYAELADKVLLQLADDTKSRPKQKPVCWKYPAGKCKFGTNCRFLHGGIEARLLHNEECRDFQGDGCPRGPECKFLHDGKHVYGDKSVKAEIVRRECKFFGRRGGCREGATCPYLHNGQNPKQFLKDEQSVSSSAPNRATAIQDTMSSPSASTFPSNVKIRRRSP